MVDTVKCEMVPVDPPVVSLTHLLKNFLEISENILLLLNISVKAVTAVLLPAPKV